MILILADYVDAIHIYILVITHLLINIMHIICSWRSLSATMIMHAIMFACTSRIATPLVKMHAGPHDIIALIWAPKLLVNPSRMPSIDGP